MAKIFLIFLSIIHFSYASHPTTEGLFRHGNNPEISANLVVVKAMVSSELSEVLLDKETSEAAPEEEGQVTEHQKSLPYYVKFLLSVEENKAAQLIQVIYSNGKMNDEDIVDLKFYSSLTNKVKNSSPKAGLFYALLSSLALNRSQEMDTFLKLNSKTYKSNKELINKEKLALYEKYKTYLGLIKNDESIKETMDNPIRPSDPEVQKAVGEVMKKPFLLKDESLTLKKAQQGYEWHLKNDILEGNFDSDTLRIEKLSYKSLEKEINMTFDDFILFNGTHELPKIIKIKDEKKDIKIRVVELTHLNMGDRSMPKRYGEYQKKVSEIKKDPDFKLESFLFL